VSELGFMHNRLLQAAGAVLAVAALGACTSSLDGSGASSESAPAVAAPSPAQTYTPPATPEEGTQWDAAYDFITGFDDSDLTTQVSLPTSITLPKVRTAVLKAAELKVASDAVYDAETDPTDPTVAKRLSLIQEPDVKTRAVKGLVKGTYAGILYNLMNGTTDDVAAERTFLATLLAEDPADQNKLQAGVVKYAALTGKADSNDALSSAWSDAYDDANGYWSDLYDDAGAAAVAIYDHSPKSEAQSKKSEAEYQKLLHHCDGLAEPAASKCAADEAVSDADGGYESLFAPWVKKVKDPAQKRRLETAAANAAISDIGEGYDSLADEWLPYVHNDIDLDRIDRAYVKEAKSDYDEGYDSLGDNEVSKIHDPALKAEARAYGK